MVSYGLSITSPLVHLFVGIPGPFQPLNHHQSWSESGMEKRVKSCKPLIQIPMIGENMISPLFWPCQPLKVPGCHANPWRHGISPPWRTTIFIVFHSDFSRILGTSEICEPSKTWHGFPEPPQMPNPHVLCLVAIPKTQRIGCWLCQFLGGPLHGVFFPASFFICWLFARNGYISNFMVLRGSEILPSWNLSPDDSWIDFAIAFFDIAWILPPLSLTNRRTWLILPHGGWLNSSPSTKSQPFYFFQIISGPVTC